MCSAPRATAPAQFKGTVLVLLVFCNLMIARDQEHVKLCVYVCVRYGTCPSNWQFTKVFS